MRLTETTKRFYLISMNLKKTVLLIKRKEDEIQLIKNKNKQTEGRISDAVVTIRLNEEKIREGDII